LEKGYVSVRKVACQAVFALGCFFFIQLVGVRSAQAESPRKVGGFDALATLGYGFAVGDPTWWDDTEVAPYGVTVGLDLGYTLPFGLRIGADLSHGFGRRIEQTLSTGEVVVTDVANTGFGGAIGYDLLLLSSFRLRGAVDAGLMFFYGDAIVPTGAAYYIGPEVALLWQYRALELGLQTKYWVTSADGSADHDVVQVGLMSGVRF